MTTRDNTPTVETFLTWAIASLAKANIPTARLDSLILLEDTLHSDRAYLLAHPERAITKNQWHTLEELIRRREQHIPLAYLRGKVAFYGRTFYVNRDTLIPRPETEDAITLLKACFQHARALSVADVGTGSGCLGLTAALELPDCAVDLYDIDAKALAVAKKNARQLGVSAKYRRENLLSRASKRKYDAILANLPYVANGYTINRDAEFEPKLALFAGPDGLDDYRTFWKQLENFESKPQYVLTESQPETQHTPLILLANKAGYEIRDTHGFIQLFSLT